MSNPLIPLSLLIGSLFLTTPLTLAKPVQIKFPNGILANADYRAGDPKLPSIMVLHGFMTTHHFNLIQAISDELEANGYTVLAPTLSLNIDNRQQGLSCEAIHTHSMANDTQEIDWWLDWLAKQSSKHVIFIGHSTAALQMAEYLKHKNPKDMVRQAIFIAPSVLGGRAENQKTETEDIRRAKNMLTHNNKQLAQFTLSYCKNNYNTPAEMYLSYIGWTMHRAIETFKGVPIPFRIIVAGADTRYGDAYLNKMVQNNFDVHIIKDANHFFDATSEFELTELLLSTIVNE